ncbi:hypothetical protein CN265_04000 [Priestia megaterium]|nr:hypothetical protein CN265_04000 [Priestia megaterium]
MVKWNFTGEIQENKRGVFILALKNNNAVIIVTAVFTMMFFLMTWITVITFVAFFLTGTFAVTIVVTFMAFFLARAFAVMMVLTIVAFLFTTSHSTIISFFLCPYQYMKKKEMCTGACPILRDFSKNVRTSVA